MRKLLTCRLSELHKFDEMKSLGTLASDGPTVPAPDVDHCWNGDW